MIHNIGDAVVIAAIIAVALGAAVAASRRANLAAKRADRAAAAALAAERYVAQISRVSTREALVAPTRRLYAQHVAHVRGRRVLTFQGDAEDVT